MVSTRASPADKEIIIIPLHSACPTLNTVFSFGPCYAKKFWAGWRGSREGTQMIKGLGSLPYEERLKELD